ncbi:MAG: hypothetical protein ACUZ8N_08115 [Candidatus Scalindua sp.]
MDISEKITNQLANTISERISRKVELSLKGMKDGLQSSDDSGLENLWDEVCVQLQSEQSIFWDLYNDYVIDLIKPHIEKLEHYEKTVIWLQTDRGSEWEIAVSGPYKENDGLYSFPIPPEHEVSEKDSAFCYNTDNIAEYIASEYVYEKAGTYRNKKIIRYLEMDGYL